MKSIQRRSVTLNIEITRSQKQNNLQFYKRNNLRIIEI